MCDIIHDVAVLALDTRSVIYEGCALGVNQSYSIPLARAPRTRRDMSCNTAELHCEHGDSSLGISLPAEPIFR